MRKIFFILLAFTLFTFPLWARIVWEFEQAKNMNILVVDKTVLSYPAQEHNSFYWILTNEKFVKWNSELYNSNTNYLGFFPLANKKYLINGIEKRNKRTVDSIANRLDVLYYTDAYGIYFNDWFDKDVRNKSKKIYGGLSIEDLYLLNKSVENGKLVISEFNCMGSPTSYSNRLKFEEIYKLKWTGWIGRYFDELDTNKNKELPRWFIDNYEAQYSNWDFIGFGIIFVHESGDVAVLEGKRHLVSALPYIRTQKSNQELYNLPDQINYPFWFEINQSSRKNNIISTFNINTNSNGDSILIKNNILKVFPAVVEREVGKSKLYYFAADFADNPINVDYAKFKYLDKLKRISINNKSQVNRTNFFYLYYLPLMHKILDDRYNASMYTKKKAIRYF